MKTNIPSLKTQLPHHRKSSGCHFSKFTALAAISSALFLGAGPTASAVVLDNFNDNLKTAWTDTPNGGSITEAGSVFTVNSTAVAGALASSKKTSSTFTLAAGHTIEIRVGVNTISPGATPNGHAVLGWVPSGALLSSGYSLSVGTNDITISRAGGGVSYTTNLATGIQSTNLVLVLRLTPAGAAVDVRGSVYKKGAGNYTLLFEYTLNDPVGLTGTGNAALGALNTPSGAAASVVFDDLEAFDILNSQFSSNFTAARLPEAPLGGGVFATADGWVDYRPAGAINNTTVAGELAIFSAGAPATFLNATYYNGKTFKISDGSRLEFQVDIKTGSDNPVIVPIISYLPNGLPDLASLATYFIGQGNGLVAAGKSATVEWVPNATIALKNSNVRFVQNMSGEGTAVRLEQRIEDLDVPVNDPARVLFQTAYLDSAATYINKNGYYCLLVYHDSGAGAAPNMSTFDNALVNQTAPGNSPPIIGSVSPSSGKAFVDATNRVTFTVADDVNTPLANIVLTLNGVRYTNGSPGVAITPTGATSTFRTFTLSNLTANVFYDGTIVATDDVGASSTLHYEFDTFLTSNLQVEVEDYNFSLDATTGGAFIDNPILVAEGGTAPNSFAGQVGLQDIDFHDNRGAGGTYPGTDHSYRGDNPRTYHTGDGPRAKYVAAGGEAGGFYETQVASDVENGDWMNYTRTYPAGTYNVYLRAATYNLPYSLVTLERVTSDPTTNGQTTALIGSFVQLGDIAGGTGYDVHRNVPLTDAAGNLVVVRFSGAVQTLRLREVFTDFHSDTFQNYMVFVPAADPGTLRPVVAMTSPVADSTTRMSSMPEATFASIANRDTTVNVGTVALQINGVPVPSAVVTAVGGGAAVAWSLTNLPPARVLTNTLTFQDSDGTNLTYSWTYSYPFLSATNRLPVGSLSDRGFAHRTAQVNTDYGDSLIRAEQQLSTPPEIVNDITWVTNIQTLDWNDDNGINSQGQPNYWTPGLDGGISGNATGPYNYIATEDLGYLALTAGAHRFEVSSDDGFQLRSGTTPSDVNALVLAQADGNTFGGTFDFMVEADGLYPIRNLWNEQAGGAHFWLKAVDFATGNHLVVNDPLNPAGVVKAYLPGVPTLLLSASDVSGPFSIRREAVVNTAAKTVTVPVTGATQFFRMSAATALTIQSVQVVGGNIVITYL